MKLPELKEVKVCIVGLGYVGLPLAAEFAKNRSTHGFDISAQRIADLRDGVDHTEELSSEELAAAKHLVLTTDPEDIKQCNVYIITVPTPVNRHNYPDLRPLEAASAQIGKMLKPGDCVIYESTVYPGATEDECVPILERESGLKFNKDFGCGYSPERINPGDKEHRVTNILKVTAGSTPEVAKFVDALYQEVITAGTHLAPSIQVAEAAKAIENTQRDVNIALVNEFALMFRSLGLDSEAVLAAAGTKWNFLPFKPGLVGGHCIGVDPYYLIHKAQDAGFHPEIITAARRINDGMGAYITDQVVRLMIRHRIGVVGSNILMMGLTFKEDCPDLRNTRIVDIVQELRNLHATVDVYDPWVDPIEAETEYGITPIGDPPEGKYDAVILAVAHRQFKQMKIEKIRALGRARSVVYDIKYLFPAEETDGRL